MTGEGERIEFALMQAIKGCKITPLTTIEKMAQFCEPFAPSSINSAYLSTALRKIDTTVDQFLTSPESMTPSELWESIAVEAKLVATLEAGLRGAIRDRKLPSDKFDNDHGCWLQHLDYSLKELEKAVGNRRRLMQKEQSGEILR